MDHMRISGIEPSSVISDPDVIKFLILVGC